MKKRIFCIMLVMVLMFTVLASCSNKNDDTPSGMMKIGGDSNSYSLYVPTTWEEKSSTGFTSAACTDKSNISVQVMSVRGIFTNGKDGYAIMTNTDTYYDMNEYFMKEYFPYLESAFANIDLKESYTTNQTFGGSTYTAKYVYTVGITEVKDEDSGKVYVPGEEYTIMQIFSAHDSAIYIFTYTATTSNYNLHLEEVNLITENFKY